MPLTFLSEVVGGLGLFLLGMKSVSEGLQKLAGSRVRLFLEKSTGNRLTAAFVGSCLASLLQSGGAASILVIGFMNAGLLSLYQALGVLLGTGIGATVAIQFIAFRVSVIAFPAIFIGVVLKFFFAKRTLVYTGDLILGVGLVFLGLQVMEAGFLPVKQNTLFQGLHSSLFTWHVTSVLLGAVVTFMIQSASAAAGIVIALTGSGLFSPENGIAMIIGEFLGTSLIAVIASINGTAVARRTALLFLGMNVSAVLLVLLFFPSFLAVVSFMTQGKAGYDPVSAAFLAEGNHLLSRSLANAHTLFSCFQITLFLPLIGFLARSTASILPGSESEPGIEARCRFIDLRVVNTPSIALLQAKQELKRMGEIAGAMYAEIAAQLFSFNARRSASIRQKEEVLDLLQREISDFLVLLSRKPFLEENVLQLPVLLQVVNNLEHIGDQCHTLLNDLERKKERRVRFSSSAMSELKEMSRLVGEIVSLSVQSTTEVSEDNLKKGRMLKDSIHAYQELMSSRHIERLTSGACSVLAGVIYSDMTASFGKIAEYSFNILKADRRWHS